MLPLSEKIADLQDSLSVRPSLPGGLTQREVEVLRLLELGMTNQEIADVLYIAVRTVSNHVTNILEKLKCNNRVEAAAFAHRHKLTAPIHIGEMLLEKVKSDDLEGAADFARRHGLVSS